MADEKFHCKECAGLSKSKGEWCTTCDGEGNPKKVEQIEAKPVKKPKKK